MPIIIEPLAPHHDRAAFSCGEADIDAWFRQRAGQDEKRNVARVFVALDADLGVVGFYSLSSYTVTLADLPGDLAKKLPKYEAIPAALIGRLARDVRMRGQRLGELLVADAMKRIVSAGRALAVYAIVVDAKNARAADFYQALGFRPFQSRPRRLFVPTSVAATALERSG